MAKKKQSFLESLKSNPLNAITNIALPKAQPTLKTLSNSFGGGLIYNAARDQYNLSKNPSNVINLGPLAVANLAKGDVRSDTAKNILSSVANIYALKTIPSALNKIPILKTKSVLPTSYQGNIAQKVLDASKEYIKPKNWGTGLLNLVKSTPKLYVPITAVNRATNIVYPEPYKPIQSQPIKTGKLPETKSTTTQTSTQNKPAINTKTPSIVNAGNQQNLIKVSQPGTITPTKTQAFPSAPYTPPSPPKSTYTGQSTQSPVISNTPKVNVSPKSPNTLLSNNTNNPYIQTGSNDILRQYKEITPTFAISGNPNAVDENTRSSIVSNIGNKVNTTQPKSVNTGQTKPLFVPEIEALRAQKQADLLGLAEQRRLSEAANRENLNLSNLQANTTYADIIGGRAPGLLGMALTGAARGYQTAQAKTLADATAQAGRIESSYAQAISNAQKAYEAQLLDEANRKAQLAAMIRSIGA